MRTAHTAHVHVHVHVHVDCTRCMRTYTCSPFGNKNKKAKPTEEDEEAAANDTLSSPRRASMSPSNFIASASNF